MFIIKAGAIAAALVCVSGGTAAAHSGPPPFQAVTVYALGPSLNYVAEYEGTPGQWTIIGGAATSVYAGSAGVFAVSPGSGDIYQYDGTPDEWTNLGFDQVQDVAVGTNCVYAERQDGEDIEQWTSGTGWVGIGSPVQGTVRELLAGGGGFVVNVPSTETEWEYNGTPGSWSEIGTDQQLEVEAVSTDYIYGIEYDQAGAPTDVEVYSGTGTQWTIIGGSATPPLAAGD